MSALLLAIKKLIAVLTAFFIPTATAAPAVLPQHSRVVTVSIFDHIKDDDNTAPHIAEDEQLEPVAEWDVSATENDDVSMSFYDTEDANSVLEQLSGKITALFAPMTAYAADVEFIENPDQGGDGEFGAPSEGGKQNDANAPIKGTVVVSGTGRMIQEVYAHLIDPAKYVDQVVKAFAADGVVVEADYAYGYDDANFDFIRFMGDVQWKVVNPAGSEPEYAEMTDAVYERIDMSATFKFIPEEIIIEDGVTNVSDYAFQYCSAIKTVILPESLKYIGMFAFANCENLTTVNFSSNLEEIGMCAFANSTKLDNIVIPGSVSYIGSFSFDNILPNANITFPNENLKDMFLNTHDAANYIINVTPAE